MLDTFYEFCKELSLCPCGHGFARDAEYGRVWYFAEEADAQMFVARFRGETINPDDRPRWPGNGRKKQ